tara:strand:+ start:268 stop:504 length:237 start_codon:yes stop_codon:yes gene_type:complete
MSKETNPVNWLKRVWGLKGDKPKFRVEAMQKSEVFQWVEADSREEALQIAESQHRNWDVEQSDSVLEVYDLEVTEEVK